VVITDEIWYVRYRQTDRQTDTHTHTHTERERERERRQRPIVNATDYMYREDGSS